MAAADRRARRTSPDHRAAYYAAIIQSSPLAIFDLDRGGHVRSVWNGAAERIFGWRADEVIGHLLPIVPKEKQPEFDALRTRAFNGQFLDGVAVRRQRKDGSPVDVRVWTAPLLNSLGSADAIIAMLTDITQQRETERALVESAAQLRLQAAALEAAANAIVITDAGGRIVWTNPAFTEVTGYTAEEARGRTPTMLKSGHHDRAFYQDLWNTILAGRVWRGEITNRRKDGRLYVEEQTITPVRSGEGEITHFIAVKQDVTLRKQAIEQVERQLRDIQALHDIDLAIASSLDLQLTLRIILDRVTARLGVDAADVLLVDAATQMLTLAAGRGFTSPIPQRTQVRMGEGWAGKAALERQRLWLPDLAGVPVPSWVSEEGFSAYGAVPLIAKGDVKGVLEVFHRAPLPADENWLGFLEVLGTQVALAIDNITTFESLQRANMELQVAYDATLEGWVRALDLRDKEPPGHTQRVTDLAGRLAQAMGVGERDMINIRRGALLHDIGKIAVPDSVLLKTDPLTPEERAIMERYPAHAYDLLSSVPHLRAAMDIPYCHHERWDGTGYPRGLKGEEIPLSARIFAVVNVWDALRSDRPGRSTWPREQAEAYLREQAGAQFDPSVVDAFLAMAR